MASTTRTIGGLVAPLLLSIAALRQEMTGSPNSVGWGLAFEVVNEAGFAMLVPVALSFFSRVAPQALQGVTIAMFYLNSFLANLVVGRLGGLLEQMPASRFWLMHAAIVSVGGPHRADRNAGAGGRACYRTGTRCLSFSNQFAPASAWPNSPAFALNHLRHGYGGPP